MSHYSQIKPLVIFFKMANCMPCSIFKPTFDSLSKDGYLNSLVNFETVLYDNLTPKWREIITQTPTVMIVYDSNSYITFQGNRTEDELYKFIVQNAKNSPIGIRMYCENK